MNISDKLNKIFKNEKLKFEKDQKYQDFINLYNELQLKGIIVKKEYDIPLTDTLGKTSLFKASLPHTKSEKSY